jgi:hypothetical protein
MILVNQVHRRVVGRHFGGGGDTTTAAVRVPIVEPDVGAGGEGRAWLQGRAHDFGNGYSRF